MVRAQIQFAERQYKKLRVHAHRHRISISEAVRRLVDRGLGDAPRSAEPTGALALLERAGTWSSGLPDIGRRHDDYLAEDFDD